MPCRPEHDENVAAKECAVSIDESVCESVCESVWEYGCFPVVETSPSCAPTQGKVKITTLRFIDVVVNGKAVIALKDSGGADCLDQPESVARNSHRSHGEDYD